MTDKLRIPQSSKARHAYCVRCGYMFIKTPPDPPVPCRCGRMQEVPDAA